VMASWSPARTATTATLSMDDHNTDDGDGCKGDFMSRVGGDGIVDSGKECDDGNTVNRDDCQGDCRNPVCSDGTMDSCEKCDVGNTVYGNGCQAII